MKYSFKRATLSKAAKAARKRNFRLYRLSGMLGNLAQMRYECGNNPALVEGIETAMDSVHALIQQTREEASPSLPKRKLVGINEYYTEFSQNGVKVTPAMERALLLHGAVQRLSETYTSKEQ